MCATRPAAFAAVPFWNATSVLIVQAASAAVSGCPSDHLAPERVWNVQVFPSFETPHLVAKSGANFSCLSYWTRNGYTYMKVVYASWLKATNGFSESIRELVPSRSTPPSLTFPFEPLFDFEPHPAASSATSRIARSARLLTRRDPRRRSASARRRRGCR